MKKQVYNPFLPLWEYIPDGEPHVFGDRIYLYGSHDKEGGLEFCEEGNYVCWSAPVNDLTAWEYHGVIYDSTQDPRTKDSFSKLYAPDVVRGNDGKYYLYYCISGGMGSSADTHNTPIGVAVCDTPAGRYHYFGYVRNPDGTPYLHYLPHDPALINDNGQIHLYHGYSISTTVAKGHGNSGSRNAAPDFSRLSRQAIRKQLLPIEQMLFHRSAEELVQDPEDLMGANHVRLCDDMLTVTGRTTRIVPGQLMAYGTEFEGHAFYEASSIRKINDTYYFIYSDENSNMLSYATSKYPDRDFHFRGVLISNGDVGLNGRKPEDRLNLTANNHGSLECINGQWYIFYHRHTHNSTYSRQACAEPVVIAQDGTIRQVECTSCGLNAAPLATVGAYPAAIACNITNGSMPHIANRVGDIDIPCVTHDLNDRYITNITAGTKVVYKYFRFRTPVILSITVRGTGCGTVSVQAGQAQPGGIPVSPSACWHTLSILVDTCADAALELEYQGTGRMDLLSLSFQNA